MTAETNCLKAKASTIASAIERFEVTKWKARLLYSTINQKQGLRAVLNS
jgi:hypothetical protein